MSHGGMRTKSFNGYLAFDDFADEAVKLAFFKWYRQNEHDHVLANLVYIMRQCFNSLPFALFTDERKLDTYVHTHRNADISFIVFKVENDKVMYPVF